MKILALEFSSDQRGAALLDARVIAKPVIHERVQPGPKQLEPFALIDSVLKDAGTDPAEVDVVAVALGPGSYTGIRVAISIAQGWALARSVRVRAVGSVDCMARQALRMGLRGTAHFVVDAQRNEFYWATYELMEGDVRLTQPLKLASLADIQSCAGRGELVLGPEVTQWIPEGRLLFPSAADLAHLAQSTSDSECESLAPVYLRATTFVKAPPPRTVL